MAAIEPDWSAIPGEIGLVAVGAAVGFAALARREPSTLLALVVLGGLGMVAYQRLRTDAVAKAEGAQQPADLVRREAAAQVERYGRQVDLPLYYAAKFAKLGIRFLPNNQGLLEILHDLRFVRVYDRPRYGKLLLVLEKLQKVYEYLLAGRYEFRSYMDTFLDLRDEALEIMYSFVLVVPEVMLHAYGLFPRQKVHDRIGDFTALSRQMLRTLENYGRMHDKEPYLPPTGPFAADRPFDPMQARRLP